MLNFNKKHNILFLLSGSIAAFKACALISELAQDGHQIQVACTKNTFNFIGEATLEGLSQKPVISSTFTSGHMMEHIHLARWASMVIFCPATANSINKLAAGIADDIVGNLILAKESHIPLYIVPAMNKEMYLNPITQKSLEHLTHLGHNVLKTQAGHQACGEVGLGRMLEPSEIKKLVFEDQNTETDFDYLDDETIKYDKPAPPNHKTRKKVLITAGGTKESIDQVRFITNFSSGNTAKILAEKLERNDYDVVYLHATDAKKPKNAHLDQFTGFNELYEKIEHYLSTYKFDYIIHAAAVSDYSPTEIKVDNITTSLPLTKKINSGSELTIKLKQNIKIVNKSKELSRNKDITVVAFKLTNSDNSSDIKNALQKIASSKINTIDYIVHNNLPEITDNKLPHVIYRVGDENLDLIAQGQTKADMADNLINCLSHGSELASTSKILIKDLNTNTNTNTNTNITANKNKFEIKKTFQINT